MMQLGLWKGSKRAYYTDTAQYESIQEDYEVRPQYYAYSLMSKHVPKGAEVYPIFLNDDFAIGTAFKGTDGKWVYVFANGNADGDALKLGIQTAGTFEKYVYEENALPQGDGLIAQSGANVTGDIFFDLAPQTVVVWREK
jgi:alpha-galactosidase